MSQSNEATTTFVNTTLCDDTAFLYSSDITFPITRKSIKCLQLLCNKDIKLKAGSTISLKEGTVFRNADFGYGHIEKGVFVFRPMIPYEQHKKFVSESQETSVLLLTSSPLFVPEHTKSETDSTTSSIYLQTGSYVKIPRGATLNINNKKLINDDDSFSIEI